jgi:hypothetical protein
VNRNIHIQFLCVGGGVAYTVTVSAFLTSPIRSEYRLGQKLNWYVSFSVRLCLIVIMSK